jgi:microcystin-dependent protein
LVKSVLQATFPNAQKMFNFITTNKTVGNYTVAYPSDMNTIQILDATAGGRTVTLPNPSSPANVHSDGWKIWITKFDSSTNTVTINGGGNLINGASSYVLKFQNQMVELVWSNAVNAWYLSDNTFGLPPAVGGFTANYTVLPSDFLRILEFNTTTGSWIVTLPTTGIVSGFSVKVFKTDSSINPLVLTPAAGTINGLSSLSLYGLNDGADLYFNGTLWRAFMHTQDNDNVGSVGLYMLESVPGPKWLPMAGANFNRTTYAPLFAKWSTNFGLGDGSTTAGMPDIRGYGLRFWANGATTDPDRAARTDRGDGTAGDHIGTKQPDAMMDHTHFLFNTDNVTTPNGVPVTNAQQAAFQSTLTNVGSYDTFIQGSGTAATIGLSSGASAKSGTDALTFSLHESRMKNIYVGAYVKALP